MFPQHRPDEGTALLEKLEDALYALAHCMNLNLLDTAARARLLNAMDFLSSAFLRVQSCEELSRPELRRLRTLAEVCEVARTASENEAMVLSIVIDRMVTIPAPTPQAEQHFATAEEPEPQEIATLEPEATLVETAPTAEMQQTAELPLEMPAMEKEVYEAEKEGIGFQFLSIPLEVIFNDNKIIALRCIRTELGDLDETGRRKPIPIKGSEFEIKTDQIIIAIGQTLERLPIEGLKYSADGVIEVDPMTLKTGIEGVFAGGDVTKGPGSVIEAIEAGRRAASSIDRFLGGDGLIEMRLFERPSVYHYNGKREESFSELRRINPSTLPIPERLKGFEEVEKCLTGEEAMMEAKRCLQCDLEIKMVKEQKSLDGRRVNN